MKPHFFGDSARPLFGVHTPSASGLGETGVVICPPMGQEGLRAYRTLRLLADQLALAGAEVLRFDFFGTGDSAGDVREGRPSIWLENVRSASQHLRELAPVRRVVLVGLRLGGTLALLAEVPATSRVILWDPILDSRDYITELNRDAVDPHGDEWEVRGFPIGAAFRGEMASMDLGTLRRVPPDVRIVTTQESPGLAAFQTALEGRRARVETDRIEAPRAWADDEAFGVGAVPAGVLRRIVEWTS